MARSLLPQTPLHLAAKGCNRRRDGFGRDGERKLRACRQPRLHGAVHGFAWHQASAIENFNAYAHEPPCQATALTCEPRPNFYNTITRPSKPLPNFYNEKAGDCSGDC